MTEIQKLILGLEEVKRFILNSAAPDKEELCRKIEAAVEVLNKRKKR